MPDNTRELDASDFKWRRFGQKHADRLVELLGVLDKFVETKTVLYDSDGNRMPSHLQPEVVRNTLELKPAFSKLFRGESKEVDFKLLTPCDIGYTKMIFNTYKRKIGYRAGESDDLDETKYGISHLLNWIVHRRTG